MALRSRRTGDARPAARIAPSPDTAAAEGTGRHIVCAACRHRITTEAARMEVAGRHDHRCVNPNGLLFHIGCFRTAPGCRTLGPPTTEFTWFPGFGWNFAHCAACGTLLGWCYYGGERSFFGLILDRLASGDSGR